MTRRLAAAFALAVVVLAAAAGSLLLLDRVNAPPRFADPGIASVDTTRHTRLLVLVVDSWRYETAVDSTLMPQVARLRKRGASWPMGTVFEGFTVPAVQAAFTGHSETQLINVIRNFRVRELAIESFFQDASRLGKRVLVVGNEPFNQFGPYFERRLPEARGRSMYETDRMRPDIALRSWRDGQFDVVVCHYESADWVAHEVGIASPRYRREFAYADSLIAAFAAALRPNDYLLVFGDHGHNARGEHKTGLRIPTFGMVFGPDITAAASVDLMATGNIRYIASHAVGITLRSAPYDMTRLARLMPVPGDSVSGAGAEPRGASRRVGDYALAWGALLVAAALAWAMRKGMTGDGLTWSTAIAVTAALVLGSLALGAIGVAEPAPPTGIAILLPLYVAAIGAKLVVLDGVAGRARLRSSIAWTVAISLVELRVWDSPISCLCLLVAGVVAYARGTDDRERRVAVVAILSALVYFTLRVPIFQLTWIDLFIAGAWLMARGSNATLVDATIAVGSVALTTGLTPSGLEWGFLYTMFPAHVVERHVQLFVPLIIAKLPLVLVLTLVAIGRPPSRRLIDVLLVYAGIRFAEAWVMRLGGAASVEIWPPAEQGMYLTTFVLAVVLWAWDGALVLAALRVRRTASPEPGRG